MARAIFYKSEDWSQHAVTASYKAPLLANEFGISRRQLERWTRKQFGQSPVQWLKNQRLEKAADQLGQRQTIKEVAINLGFRQVSHFCREFKKRFGMAPGAYAARASQERVAPG